MSRKFTQKHEWIEATGDVWRVGITEFASGEIGDVVAVELPDVGKTLAIGDECGVIESVKAASDIYSPASGEVAAVNTALEDSPELLNESPEADGWLMDLRLSNPDELESLMDAAGYAKFLEESE